MLGNSAALSSSATAGGLRFSFPCFATRVPRSTRMPPSSSSSPSLSPPRALASSATDPTNPKKPWLLVGLGNPGKMYQGTRHNVGFEMLDAIAEAEGISVSKLRFRAMFGEGRIGNAPVMLAKPQTFMNASGWITCLIFQHTIESSTSDV